MTAAPPPVPRPGRPAARPAAAPGRGAAPARAPIAARGAVDLSTYRAPAPVPAAGSGAPGAPGGPQRAPGAVPAGSFPPGSFTRVVTEAGFQADVLEQSMTVPVVIDLWATWCEPCKALSPVLERLADEYGGRLLLATVDVDAEQRIAAALQVKSIPTVLGVVAGQLVPLFTGAVPEAQVRQVMEELVRVAVENGVTGVAEPVAPAGADGAGGAAGDAPAESPEDPRFTAAYDAAEAGDYATAVTVFRGVLAVEPGLEEAVAGLAQVSLLARTAGTDTDAAVTAAAAAPDDVPTGLAAADAEFVAGAVTEAFDRLVGLVRVSSGRSRDEVRARVLELFDVLGTDDPRVAGARVKLANALF